MTDLMSHEGTIRIAAFAGVLVLMMCLEAILPRRLRTLGRKERWTGNLGIVVVDTVLARLLIPLPPVAAALWAANEGIGLLHLVDMPYWAAFAVGVIGLDLAIYCQHVVFHKVPVLWRLHRMHHADTEIDVTTGLRFHPIEILLSFAIKIALVVAFGLPAEAVITFEVILNATSMFNHSNLRLPGPLDRALRALIVTPDMHRVHHSWHPDETNSNYSFNLSVWDRLFGTYRAQPRDGHDGMTIGLKAFREAKNRSLWGLITIPFRS